MARKKGSVSGTLHFSNQSWKGRTVYILQCEQHTQAASAQGNSPPSCLRLPVQVWVLWHRGYGQTSQKRWGVHQYTASKGWSFCIKHWPGPKLSTIQPTGEMCGRRDSVAENEQSYLKTLKCTMNINLQVLLTAVPLIVDCFRAGTTEETSRNYYFSFMFFPIVSASTFDEQINFFKSYHVASAEQPRYLSSIACNCH